MIHLEVTEIDLTNIDEVLGDPEIDPQIKNRLLVVKMHHERVQHGAIARCLKMSADTVTNVLKLFRAEGLPGVIENRYYQPSSTLAPFWQWLKCSFLVSPVANAKQAVQRIKQLTGIGLSESQARRNMKRLGLTLRKCGQVPGKANPQLQFEFFQSEMQPRLYEAAEGRRKVFFVDAAHFVLGAFLGMLWCFSRISVKTGAGRQRYSVLGALDSHSKEIIKVTTEGNVHAGTVCELLEKIRLAHPDVPVTLILDNARYQHCRCTEDKASVLNIELLFLPAYGPNLNLIERLWKLVKKECLLNRYHSNFTSFKAAIDGCLDQLGSQSKDKLYSLASLNFQFFPFPKTPCA